jgi:hypothetical protein
MMSMAGTGEPAIGMRRAWALFALTLLAAAGSLALTALNGSTAHGATAAWNGWGEVVSWDVVMLIAAGLGVLVAAKRPENRIADVFLSGGLLGVLAVLGDQYAGYALVARPSTLPGGVFARFVSFLCFAASWFVAGVLLPALFPTGRVVSPRWRVAVWLGSAGAAMWGLLIFLPGAFADDGLLGDVPGVTNPIGISALSGPINAVNGIGILALFGGMFIAIVSMVVRAVRSHGEERQQIKVVAYTLAVTTVVQLVIANTIDLIDFRGSEVVWNVFSNLALFAIPASIAIALLRYRLYDVDRVINRTLVYLAVTGVLVAIYGMAVVAIGALTQPITEGSDLAVAGATLVIAAMFGTVRRRVQGFVDRRFYRTRYDAARTLEAFAARLRMQTDLAALRGEIESVAWRTMKPAHVDLWVAKQERPARPLR